MANPSSTALKTTAPGKNLQPAPELQVERWFNTDQEITLAALRGKVVVIEAFQMLCPGCVSHGLPLAAEIADAFSPDDVQVLGLHSVFEHHDAMQPHALKAFLHEYSISYPVAVDATADPGTGPIPKTMRAYSLRGTPSLLVIDRNGRLQINHFGHAPGIRLAAGIAKLAYASSEPN
ncbi:MAG: redoxin domain-containing protein [Alphaproteobacteria bacterium]